MTVYLDPKFTGRGIGSQLCEGLLADLRGRNFHAAIGGIALPNAASIALHERLGFHKVAHFEQVGRKFGPGSTLATGKSSYNGTAFVSFRS
ncbi:MAG: GNAT family N-acetyltransferase [Candidatus Sulfotelmatobacter sp.]